MRNEIKIINSPSKKTVIPQEKYHFSLDKTALKNAQIKRVHKTLLEVTLLGLGFKSKLSVILAVVHDASAALSCIIT